MLVLDSILSIPEICGEESETVREREKREKIETEKEKPK